MANGSQCAEIWVEKSCEQTRVRRTDSREVSQWHVRDGCETITEKKCAGWAESRGGTMVSSHELQRVSK